ncbi:efflux RND transporter periplasmic adaptor subunit [Cesiribacter andamanensis]|uniref:Efflux pump periplasmic linker BepF n=1 Tax=Cesiribacter andamanensis AMV16 TaxID=1279009 RepID=M7NC16_9BACT|nr:efflux RND transporter periplasmic adaptor subunit [Cesiribacter andamanensis]EMR04716.1 Efflux pump periplasmic linker BepF [Cesiribacter andamanensis AMV16]
MNYTPYTSLSLLQTLVLLLLMAACTADGKTDSKAAPQKALPVTRVMATDTVLHREYVADIQALRNVELRARVEGFLEKIYVDEGQPVKKGQLLFRLNDEEYRAEVAKATANLESAVAESKARELEVERLKTLVEKKVIAESELKVAQARLKATHARIEEARSAQTNAQQRLSYTSIRAPFDGIIDRIPFKMGSLINHGTLLTTVSDVSGVYVYFNVSEGEYLEHVKSRLTEEEQQSTSVNLVLADGTLYAHAGSIETMQGEFQASTGSIAFRARFPNPNALLKHGATGKVRMASRIEGALLVPQKSVFEIQDKYYVFTVDSANLVHMKNFVPQTRLSHYYIVASGLQAGDRIVFEGIQEIQDGMKIVPKPVGKDSVVAL